MQKSQHAVEDGGYAFDVISVGNNSNEEAAEIDEQANGDRFSGLVSPDGETLHPEPPSFKNGKNSRGGEAECQGIVTPALPFDGIFKEVNDISQFEYPSFSRSLWVQYTKYALISMFISLMIFTGKIWM